jgi:hypothetical protein
MGLQIIFLILLFNSSPKEDPQNVIRTWKPGIETGTSLSYSGFNQHFAATVSSGNNSFYAGPKFSLTNAYLPGKSIFGIGSGVRHVFARTGNLAAYFSLDYQGAFFRPQNAPADYSKNNSVHEFNFSYGVFFNIAYGFKAGNSIGFGRYIEIFNNPVNENQVVFRGYSGLLRILILYEF